MKEKYKNMIKNYIKSYFAPIWSLREKQNQKKMLESYNQKKAVPQDEIPNELSRIYKQFTGHDLDLSNPKRYTEKIQWRKLNQRDERFSKLADKYEVREWVKNTIGEEYLIPIYGVYDSFDEIDFSALPNQFVIKTNHSSGWNIIVKDKTKLNTEKAKETVNTWMSLDFAYVVAFEFHYSSIKPKIIIEHYVEDSKGELNDYKFLCFNGNVEYCWVDEGRFKNHTRTFFDANWNRQSWSMGHEISENIIDKPVNYDKMLKIATILSKDFDHVRVDLYNVDGKVYFGEMTFTPVSGVEKFTPDQYDYEIGKLWNIK